ncbi:MAG: Gfo/Idh/MocA family oxidoreductase [Acidobacteriaceae bacterium]|nr:Gfo/Idh/MocA family oxidoreductase [Acidobacteriaceae bacterium]MBV9780328.1 Gfo/Idh/MocA family oxidoreductase [Acidobacteriaceae bacterium]
MSNHTELNRRDFLAAGTAGFFALGGAGRVIGANDRVRVAICGLHGRGKDHLGNYSQIPNVQIAALCDIDQSVLRDTLAQMEKMGLPKPVAYVDIRKLLEDKSIDAISIATQNHWHSLMAIWGCQADKDVYVEKPCSHNLWEGKQLVAAARKYNRIVQHGTQTRSATCVREAVQKMRDGLIGETYMARGLCYKWRDTIGRAQPELVPAGVDYDLWTGPARMHPFTKNRFHYNWHWFWEYGNGDIGNQGVHQVDIARLGLGVGFPNKISAIGGHFMFDDDQETPNDLSCAYEFNLPDGKRRMITFEVRHWITNHEAEIGTPQLGTRERKAAPGGPKLGPSAGAHNTIGNTFYGSNGYLSTGDEDAATYAVWLGRDQEPQTPVHGGRERDHFQNFIDCVVSRNTADLRAPIEEGHISCAMVHLANVSYRLGRTLHFDPETQQVIGDDEANLLLRDGDRGYRAPFVIPESV